MEPWNNKTMPRHGQGEEQHEFCHAHATPGLSRLMYLHVQLFCWNQSTGHFDFCMSHYKNTSEKNNSTGHQRWFKAGRCWFRHSCPTPFNRHMDAPVGRLTAFNSHDTSLQQPDTKFRHYHFCFPVKNFSRSNTKRKSYECISWRKWWKVI